VQVYCGGSPVPGATVTIEEGSTTIGSGTTDSTGNVVIGIPGDGSYTVFISKAGYSAVTSSGVNLTCGGIYGVTAFCVGGESCEPCTIPTQDLTLTWTNMLFGNGSVALTFTSPNNWRSGCAGTPPVYYVLQCTGGHIELQVHYFT
jgi:hypothetical protein